MIREALVLAGGAGTRLRSVVSDVPKPLAPIRAKPFLHYQLMYLRAQGIERVVFSLCYKPELIRSVFGSSYAGVEIDYVVENSPLGTGGAIRFASRQMREDRWFVLNGDTYFPVSLKKMADFHLKHEAGLTLALKRLEGAGRYGGVSVSHGRVTNFSEKSSMGSALINGGLFLVERPMVEALSLGKPLSFERDIIAAWVSEHRVWGYEQDAYFIDIGIPQDYERAQSEMPEMPENTTAYSLKKHCDGGT